jgi:sRNA-binding regulator protein Hfq
MNEEQIRADQAQAGRLASSNTLRARPGFRSAPINKNAPKGHEAFLEALKTSGASVHFEKVSGDTLDGVIKHSDKYTISVIDGALTRVLFKHDISEFSAISSRNLSS